MTKRPQWRDVEEAVARLTDNDRRTLLLLARLPLLWEGAIERLYGLGGGASVYRCLAGLRLAGLVDDVCPALRPGRNPRLLYLTDFGIATIALDQRVESEHLARRARLRGPDLLARLPGLSALLATYQLLAALVGARTGQPDLLAWEQPWRRRFRRPTGRTPTAVRLPAYAALSWDGEAAAYFLIPDLATFPVRVHRRDLVGLVTFRGLDGGNVPAVIVATTDARRAAWIRLLGEVGRNRAEAPLAARVVCWRELRDDPAALGEACDLGQMPAASLVRRPRLRQLEPRQPTSPIPVPIGAALQKPSSAGGRDRLALGLSTADRALRT